MPTHALLLLSDDATLQSQAMYLSNREGYLIAKFMQVTPPKETPTAAQRIQQPGEIIGKNVNIDRLVRRRLIPSCVDQFVNRGVPDV